jgi:hypothetical protein
MDIRLLLTTPPAARIIHLLVKSYGRSLRVTVERESCWRSHLDRGGRVLFVVWHQQFLPSLVYFDRFRELHPSVMISRSRDGELAANFARLMGWNPVRGSSSRGAAAALRTMVRELQRRGVAGHIADGPRGPAGRLKSGAVELARAACAAIVPVAFQAERAWLASSWDRFMIPHPFSRVRLSFGPLFLPPPRRDRDALEALRRRVEASMRRHLLGFAPDAGDGAP